MAIPVKSDKAIYCIVLLHAIVSGGHGWSHSAAMVATTLPQNIFIATVVFAAPLLASGMLIRGINAGRVLFTLSMLGSLMFGLCFHFFLDTPDLCTNVRGAGAQGFFVSALLLAAVLQPVATASPA